mgnify:CR=1 FL=1
MALLPNGCGLIKNPHGAPGFELEGIFAFPGFPIMLQSMMPKMRERYGLSAAFVKMCDEQVRLQTLEGEIAFEDENLFLEILCNVLEDKINSPL